MKPVKGYAKGGSKPSSKGRTPASKKEKLFGQELGKTGRAAERGGAVNKTQVAHRNYSERVMYANRMKNTPIKQKLSGIALDVAVAGLTNPGTLRNIQSGVARGLSSVPQSVQQNVGRGISRITRRDIVGVHVSPTQGLREIVPPPASLRGTGMGDVPAHPLVPNVSYKVSTIKGRGLGKPVKTPLVSRRAVGLGDTYYSKEGYSAYVTRSPLGKPDPETRLSGVDRITGRQRVVSEVRLPGVSQSPQSFNEWGRVPGSAAEKLLQKKIREAVKQANKETYQRAVGRIRPRNR